MDQDNLTETQNVFGQIEPPPGVVLYNAAVDGTDPIGIFVFLSSMIRIGTIVAGLWVLLNLITAGFDYITAGDAKANQKVNEKITNSVLGLSIIVASHIIIAVISLLLFGRADFILNPEICGPAGCA